MEKIPKDTYYCYSKVGVCPYWRQDGRYKTDLYGNGYIDSVWCDYLKINSAQLEFNGDSYAAHLLTDMCKICE